MANPPFQIFTMSPSAGCNNPSCLSRNRGLAPHHCAGQGRSATDRSTVSASVSNWLARRITYTAASRKADAKNTIPADGPAADMEGHLVQFKDMVEQTRKGNIMGHLYSPLIVISAAQPLCTSGPPTAFLVYHTPPADSGPAKEKRAAPAPLFLHPPYIDVAAGIPLLWGGTHGAARPDNRSDWPRSSQAKKWGMKYKS